MAGFFRLVVVVRNARVSRGIEHGVPFGRRGERDETEYATRPSSSSPRSSSSSSSSPPPRSPPSPPSPPSPSRAPSPRVGVAAASAPRPSSRAWAPRDARTTPRVSADAATTPPRAEKCREATRAAVVHRTAGLGRRAPATADGVGLAVALRARVAAAGGAARVAHDIRAHPERTRGVAGK